MDNIATQLTQLQTIKQDIATAIEEKGGTVGEGFDTYATAISNIPSGGSGTPQIRLSENSDLRFGYSTFSSVPNYIILDVIPTFCFFNCSSLTSVTIPNSVTTIGHNAFEGCSSLTSVTIPNSVTLIDEGVFSGCTSLTSVTIPNSVEIIYDQAFQDCNSLTGLTIPNSVTLIGNAAFNNNLALSSIILPRNPYLFGEIEDQWGNNTLRSQSFYNCQSLSSLIIPAEIKYPGYYCFSNCQSLSSLTIEEGIEFLPDGVFESCYSLTSVTIPSTVQYLNDNVFNGCQALEWIKCLPLTPPEHYEEHLWGHGPIYPFESTNDCPIYVPDAALSAYTSSSIWENYWSRIKPMSDFATDFPNA